MWMMVVDNFVSTANPCSCLQQIYKSSKRSVELAQVFVLHQRFQKYPNWFYLALLYIIRYPCPSLSEAFPVHLFPAACFLPNKHATCAMEWFSLHMESHVCTFWVEATCMPLILKGCKMMCVNQFPQTTSTPQPKPQGFVLDLFFLGSIMDGSEY